MKCDLFYLRKSQNSKYKSQIMANIEYSIFKFGLREKAFVCNLKIEI